MKNSSYEDITFSVTGEVLYLQEGSAASVALTSNKVKVDSLTFSKIEMAGAKDGVRVDITLSYNSDKPELAFSKNLISSVNRVAAITFDSDLLPDTNDLYSIGADNPRWKNGYFSGDLYVTGNQTLTGNLAVDTNTLYVDSASGYIGIGTTSPQRPLHIVGSDGPVSSFPSIGAKDFLVVENNGNSNIALVSSSSTGTYLKFSADGSTTTLGYIGYYHPSQHLLFYVNGAERIRIKSDGYVGIGTTSPTEMLEVNGNIRLYEDTPTYKIKNVATPTESSDVATKGYVDAAGTTYTQYVQYFTSSGTWTNPNASTTVSIIVVGGGGGGGGGVGNASDASAGSSGGTSSFGALASATGGSGGAGGVNLGYAAAGGAGYHQGGTGQPGRNTADSGGTFGGGGVGFNGCGSGGNGAGALRGTGAGGGSGNVTTYYGSATSASYTVTVGAGGAGGTSTAGTNGSSGAGGCVIVYWWDN